MRDSVIKAEVNTDEYVPYVQHVAPGVVLLDDQSRMAMFRVAGRGWESADPDEVDAWHNQLNVLARNIASDRLILTVHLVRAAATDDAYPAGSFRSTFAEHLDRAYRETVRRQLYRNEMFLSVLMRPPAIAGDRLGAWFARKRRLPAESAPQVMQRLEDMVEVLQADLAPYGLTRLGLRREGRVMFSEIAEALAMILTGGAGRVPLATGRLGRVIHTNRVIFGRETAEIRGDHASTFAACLGLREYPAETWPGQFDLLSSCSANWAWHGRIGTCGTIRPVP
jgi:type IV secretion system protein VirB4